MPPRPRKPSEKFPNRLLETVRFLSIICKDEGAPSDTHILLQNKTATAFNGTVGAGAIIDEDLVCAPHAKTFLNALSKCGEQYSLTQLDHSKLSIKSGPFKAVIPCIDPTLLYFPTPDANVAAIDDKFKEAIELVEKVKPENGQRVVTLSFLMNGQSIIATDGKILIEAWHGLNLPTQIPIPKATIPILLSHNKKLTGFGLSDTTVTFFFEDNSFIRSQLYAEKWPDISHITDKQSSPIPLPQDFFKGLAAVSDFSSNGFIHFNDNKIQSHEVDEKGAQFDVAGLKKGPVYSVKYLNLIKDIVETADFYVPARGQGENTGTYRSGYMMTFYGKNVRGVLMGFG